ncbi:plant cadmium resistance 2 [Zostera marina]|uniref:Plant cadmium resistance 2 n=1 Tax=Zostera marina TaxID=29655 RepID=A0A0K9NX55_ZOSMR|nr:plant cadmium resistance 2 [Zostera marina]
MIKMEKFDTQNPQQWSTKLCDCCDDPGNCCITCFFPWITFGRIAEIVDQGSSSCYNNGLLYFQWSNIGAPWIISCINREKMRVVYSLPPDPCGDCLVHFWCGPCALCQEYRELTNKGFDMKIGWCGNVQKNLVPPQVQDGMDR